MIPLALGLRCAKGGCTIVAAAGQPEPQVVRSIFLATAAAGDRLSFEPYHVAAEMVRARCGDAAAAVAEGRTRQDRLAANGLTQTVRQLRDDGYRPMVAALLVNRAGWITDLLQYSLFAPEHPAVAEGLAVRDALRFALRACGIDVVELDEKSLHEVASAELHLSSEEVDAELKRLGASAGKPWRKEQKAACLAAWVVLAAKHARK